MYCSSSKPCVYIKLWHVCAHKKEICNAWSFFVKVWASHIFIWTQKKLRGEDEKLLQNFNPGGTCGSGHMTPFGTFLRWLRNTRNFSSKNCLVFGFFLFLFVFWLKSCLISVFFHNSAWCEESVKAPLCKNNSDQKHIKLFFISHVMSLN